MRDRRGQSLAEVLSRQISGMIVQQQLRPGDPLPPEVQLTEKFSVGRGTLREAIVRLRALGILDVRHGYGTFVAALPSDARAPDFGDVPRPALSELARDIVLLREKALILGHVDIAASIQATATMIEARMAAAAADAAEADLTLAD